MKKRYLQTHRQLTMARKQLGLSLIEVLVSMVVLSLGLLGLAGLQVTGIKVTQSSHLRAQAALHAQEMVNRIRANAMNASSYALLQGATKPSGSSIVDIDRNDWLTNLEALPKGEGSIAVTGSTVTVTVYWDDRRGSNSSSSDPMSFVLETSL